MTLRRYVIEAQRTYAGQVPVVRFTLTWSTGSGPHSQTSTLREHDFIRALREAGYYVGTDLMPGREDRP